MYKKIFEKEYLMEMANISSNKSGLDKGFIQIKPEARHDIFPHIHFVYDLKKSRIEFVKFSINSKKEDIKIIQKKDINLTKYQINDIKEFIIKNYKNLKKYYMQAEVMDTDKFFKSLVSIKKGKIMYSQLPCPKETWFFLLKGDKIFKKEKLIEMALIGKPNGLIVQVYTDHNPPHFHVVKKDNYEVRISIKNQKLLDYKFQKDGKEMSSSEYKVIINWLSSKNKDEKNITNLQAIKLVWKSLNQ